MKAILIAVLFITFHTARSRNCQEKKIVKPCDIPAKQAPAPKSNLSGEGCIPGWMINIVRNLGPKA